MANMDGHIPAMLFPHCFVDPHRLKGAIGLFGSLEICLPWEMELKAEAALDEAAPFIKLLRPPEPLKPGPEFGRRLAEYREWIRHRQDKSVLTFLSSLQGDDPSEEKSWEIRKRVRGGQVQPEKAFKDQSLKHHLVLHLAEEIEESLHTAESIIDVLKTSSSPLGGALDAEEEPPGLFDDLPSHRDQPLWQGYQWSQIVEAWFGLFGQHLTGEKILLTLDPNLADFLTERFEKAFVDASDLPFPEMITVPLPHLPPALPMAEISNSGRKFFPNGISAVLEGALKAAGRKRRNAGSGGVKDPVVENLLGTVLVTLVS
jgi:hypothetical protein